MKNIEKKISNSFHNIDLPEFDFKKLNEKKGIIYMEKKKRNYLPYLITACTLMFCFLIGFSVYTNNYKVNSKIGIDVNPSVEIKLNKKEKVIDVIANNEDGNKILSNMDLKGSDINVAINALIGSIVKNGYIDELANSILISVEGNNEKENEKLRQEIVSDLNSYLTNNNLSIVSQIVSNESDLENIANQYNISLGKAKLIKDIIANNNLLSYEDLVNLSINELNLISNNNENINIEGIASDKAYIGYDKAKEIALNHANVTDITNYKIEIDYDNVIVYEIEFKSNNIEYEYDIDALTGNIIKYDVDEHSNENNNSNNNNNNSSSNSITRNEALEIALNHADISNVTNAKIELDDNSYEVEFIYNNKEYNYDISLTGKILEYSIDNDYEDNDYNINQVKITRDEALEIALNHAGVSNISYSNIKLDDNEYEVKFKVGYQEYEYEINATTGKIISFEIDD